MGKTSVPNDLSISSLIRKVHKELIKSQKLRETDREPALFEVESLTIEAHFIISQSKELKGKLDLRIVGADGTKNNKEEEVHKLILKLKTIDFDKELTNSKNKKGTNDNCGKSYYPAPPRD